MVRTVVSNLMLLGLAVGLSGCGKTTRKGFCRGQRGAAGLVGAWSADGSRSVDADPKSAALKPEERQQLAMQLGQLRMKITGDRLTMSGLKGRDGGPYRVLEDHGDRVVLELVDSAGKHRRSRLLFTYLEDDELTLHDKQLSLVFRCGKGEATTVRVARSLAPTLARAERVAAASACPRTRGAAGLVCRWVGDSQRSRAASKVFASLPAAEWAKAASLIDQSSYLISKDTITTREKDADRTLRYRVLEDKGDRVVLEAVDSRGRKTRLTLIYLADGVLQLGDDDMAMVVRRAP